MFDLKKITDGIDKIGEAMNINRKKTLRGTIATQIFVKTMGDGSFSISEVAKESVRIADGLMDALGENNGTK